MSYKKYASEQYVDEKIELIDIEPEHVIETNKGLEQKFWRGTKEEFDAVETKDENTMYIITDEDGNVSPVATNSDWAQNDETAADYIKNRTHYDGSIEGTLIDNVTYEFEQGTTYEGLDASFEVVAYTNLPYSLIAGQEYTATIDGTTEQDNCWDWDIDCPILGYGPDEPGHGATYSFRKELDGTLSIYLAGDYEEGPHTITLVGNANILKVLDRKYLPTKAILPEVSKADEGKFLRVLRGNWVALSLPNAEEASF